MNKPRCPFHAYHRDGQMRTDDNYGATTPYEPNSYGEWQDTPALKEPPLAVDGAVYNYDEREFDGLLHAAGQAVAADDARRSAGDMRKHGARHGRFGTVHQAAARAQLLQRRSVVR